MPARRGARGDGQRRADYKVFAYGKTVAHSNLRGSDAMNANEKAVAEVLAKYQDALNGSDTAAVMRLYADDGVFMPPYSQSAVGVAAVRQAYDAVFKAIK